MFIFQKSWGLTECPFEDSLLPKASCCTILLCWYLCIIKVCEEGVFNPHLLALVLFAVFVFIPPLFFYLLISQVSVDQSSVASLTTHFFSPLPSLLVSLPLYSPFPILEDRKSRRRVIKITSKKVLIKGLHPTKISDK